MTKIMEWISVKNRLPKIGEFIVVFRDIESRQTYTTHWSEEDQLWMEMNEITHFLPITEPPKE